MKPAFSDKQTVNSVATQWVIALAILVLGVTLAWSAYDLRMRIRSQIVEHDGEILDAVTLMQHRDDQSGGDTLANLSDPGEQFQLAMKVSKLRDVLGVRLYSSDGRFANAFPAYITEKNLAPEEIKRLQALAPVSQFLPAAGLAELDLLAKTNAAPVPLLLVSVPLRSEDEKQWVGAIQFLMTGDRIARQYASLDQNLILRFSLVFVVAALVLGLGLSAAFRRVQKANQLLAERTRHLLEANRELALSARVSAVGAVAAHLIHGLKNPLSGLASFVSNPGTGNDTDWQAASATTQRMQDMINRVVRVLQEQHSGVEYQISTPELADLLAQKARPAAEKAGVRFEAQCNTDETLSNHEADLILLVLENLVHNAIEATPAGKLVRFYVDNSRDGLVFEVLDQGFGLSATVAKALFKPCTSTKKGGGGIGLAISHQLAQHLGARLELVKSSTAGCVFRLIVPELKPTHQYPILSNSI